MIFQCRENGLDPLFVQTQALLERCLLRTLDFISLRLDIFFLDQSRERFPNEPTLMLVVARRDAFLLGMFGEPALAMSQKFLDLVVADPVVLVIVHDRDEDVQVRQKLAETLRGPQGNGEVAARSPVRIRGVEEVAGCTDLISQRLEQAPQVRLTSSAWQN